jgi:hypothetical protein
MVIYQYVDNFRDGVLTGEAGEEDTLDHSRATFDLLLPDTGIGARHCRANYDQREQCLTVHVGKIQVLKGNTFGQLHQLRAQPVIVGMVLRGQRGTTLQISLEKASNEPWQRLWQRSSKPQPKLNT